MMYLYNKIRKIHGEFKKTMKGFTELQRILYMHGSRCNICLTSPGTGDAYLYGRLFKSFCEKEGLNNPIFVVYRESSLKIAKMFNIEKAYAMDIDAMNYLFNLKMFMGKYDSNITCLHHHVYYRHIAILGHLEGLHGYNWGTFALDYLGLTKNDIKKPCYTRGSYEQKRLIDDYQILRGKTVILAPYAKSVKKVPTSFWEHLCDELLKHKYAVLTNTYGNEKSIKGSRAISIDLDELPYICEYSGTIIGLRSGVLDVVSEADCLKISINMLNNNRRGITSATDCFSLIGMYDADNQFEFEYSDSCEEELITNILSCIQNAVITNYR